jgi:hypothetical protein
LGPGNVMTRSAGWSSTAASPSAGASSCRTLASTCGVLTRTRHSCARPRRARRWMGRRAGGRNGDLKPSPSSARCVNGHCESTSKNIGRSDGLRHNALDGSWGGWSRSAVLFGPVIFVSV